MSDVTVHDPIGNVGLRGFSLRENALHGFRLRVDPFKIRLSNQTISRIVTE